MWDVHVSGILWNRWPLSVFTFMKVKYRPSFWETMDRIGQSIAADRNQIYLRQTPIQRMRIEIPASDPRKGIETAGRTGLNCSHGRGKLTTQRLSDRKQMDFWLSTANGFPEE
jgi:hypothetical protein